MGKGTADYTGLVVPEGVGVLTRKGEKIDVKTELTIPEIINAPVAKGQKAGEIKVIVDGKVQQRVPLIVQKGIARGGFLQQMKKTLKTMAG